MLATIWRLVIAPIPAWRRDPPDRTPPCATTQARTISYDGFRFLHQVRRGEMTATNFYFSRLLEFERA